jgi:cell division protease FtsH
MTTKNPPPKKEEDGGNQPRKNKKNQSDKFEWRKASRTLTLWILLVVVAWIVFRQFSLDETTESEKSYSQFKRLLETEQVSSAEIIEREFHGTLKDGSSITTTLPFIDSNMLAQWDSLRIDYQFHEKTTSWIGYLISSILPWVLIIAVWLYFMRRMQGGGSKGVFSFGKSRARLMIEDKNKVTFKDVAGVDEAKEELQEIISFLRDPKKFSRLGGRLPKGGLLLGPPGTGKTLLAKAVAGEADVPFFSMSGADFVEMFVGVGASRVRDLFEQGKKNAPCIIFIDEIDAVGRHRGAGMGGGHDEREQTLNQLLVEMDGFESSEGVILIAATNRPDVLDPALTRPGRFDRQIVVDRPDVRGREGILKVHSRALPLAGDVKLDILAKGTPGLAGADLANLANEAALLAARRNGKKVTMADFEEAKDKVMMGAERKSVIISDDEKNQTAYHEAGHVLVARMTPGTDPVHKVTIIPRGRALGITHYLPIDEKHNYSRSYLLHSLNSLLGGRAAEKLTFKELSTGAGNDIERATTIARKMVCEWGMSDKLGPVTYGNKDHEVFLGRDFAQQRNYSEKIAQEIDQEVRRIVTEAEKRALDILRLNTDKLKSLAEALLEREILDGHQIEIIIKGEKLPPIYQHTDSSKVHPAKRKPAHGRRPVTKKRETTAPVKPKTDAAPPTNVSTDVKSEDVTVSSPHQVKDRTASTPHQVKDKTASTPHQVKDRTASTPHKVKDRTSTSPSKIRQELARSYGVVSSRDPQNQRPSPSKLVAESKKEQEIQDNEKAGDQKPKDKYIDKITPGKIDNLAAKDPEKISGKPPRFRYKNRSNINMKKQEPESNDTQQRPVIVETETVQNTRPDDFHEPGTHVSQYSIFNSTGQGTQKEKTYIPTGVSKAPASDTGVRSDLKIPQKQESKPQIKDENKPVNKDDADRQG